MASKLLLCMTDLASSMVDALQVEGLDAPADVVIEHYLPAVDCTDALLVFIDDGDISESRTFPSLGNPFRRECVNVTRRFTVQAQLFRPCAPVMENLTAGAPSPTAKERFAGDLVDDLWAIESRTKEFLEPRTVARGLRYDRIWWPSLIRPNPVQGGTGGFYFNWYLNAEALAAS